MLKSGKSYNPMESYLLHGFDWKVSGDFMHSAIVGIPSQLLVIKEDLRGKSNGHEARE